ncbi:MAG: T9SS type B sorting domain-containing protein, partial [Bacteroidota bacterium]
PFIFVPKGFTPNDDGRNDVLFVRGNPIEEVTFLIYNRWGEQVFQSTDKNIGWDGTYKGKPLNPDVYGYLLRVICTDGEEFFKKGNVTLIR